MIFDEISIIQNHIETLKMHNNQILFKSNDTSAVTKAKKLSEMFFDIQEKLIEIQCGYIEIMNQGSDFVSNIKETEFSQ